MDKLTAIKIKYDDGTYSDEIPVSVLSENVEWDSTHTLVDVLGSIDVDVTGTIQDQISQLFNEKVSTTELNNYIASALNTDVSNWLSANVIIPTGGVVTLDKTLTIENSAADSKAVGDKINTKISKNGKEEVLPQNIQGVHVIGGNLFNTCELFGAQGGYPVISDSHIVYWQKISSSSYENYIAYLLPVSKNTNYTFLNVRWWTLVSSDKQTALNDSMQQAGGEITTINSLTASYIMFSFSVANSPIDTYVVVEGTDISQTEETIILPEWWHNGQVPIEVDKTLTIDGAAADSKAVGDKIQQINSNFNNYILLDDENKVTPQNIAGVQFTKSEEDIPGENIFSSDLLFEEGYYIYAADGVITHGSFGEGKSYCVPVDGISKYTFSQVRFACLAKGNFRGAEAVGGNVPYATEIVTTGANYLFLSYSGSTDFSNIEIHKITTEEVYSDFIMPEWMGIPKYVEDIKPKYKEVSGNLSDGTYLALLGWKQNLRKGENYIFSGDITSFQKLKIGFTNANAFSTSTPLFNEFTIDNTNITYKTRSTNESYTNQYAHGLTLTNNIQFIFEYLSTGQSKITLISNGSLFTQTLPFTKQTISQVVVISENSTLTKCKLTWTPSDINKKIWLFGDSYIAYSPTRWPYYLHNYNYDNNVLLDGWPGEGSVNARNSLMTLIQFGTPKYIVWCMGMNDGSDTDASTPNSNWTVRRDEMLTICNNNSITPIFATIPNVPSILHTGKNAWIKASGYRYIDFAAAVGAESANSTWFTGMLSSDNVHPTEQGAKALFARVLLDFPEIMLNNF